MSSLIGVPTDRWSLTRAVDALSESARQAGRPGLVWLVGLLSTNFVGKKFLEVFDRVLENLPLVKSVYSASKQLVDAVSPKGRRSFRRVVLVEFPKKGTFALGFVTGGGVGALGQGTASVYVPTAINPTSGFVVFVREDEVVDAGLTVEEGLKLVVSGGVVGTRPLPEDSPRVDVAS